MAQGRPIEPIVSYYEDRKDPNNYVCYCIDIPDLKRGCCGGLNGSVNLSYTRKSFTLTATVDGTGYKYEKELLLDIIGGSHKVTTGEVEVRLRKAKPGSWAEYLRDGEA